MAVTEASRPLHNDILKNGSLIHPRDGANFPGRALLFIWSLCDSHAPERRSRLTIKPKLLGQDPQQAFDRNDRLVETDVAFVEYLTLDVAALGDVRSDFVWRVAAMGEGTDTPLAVSEIRSFSCTQELVDLSWIVSHEAAMPPEAQPAPPPKPKVAKGSQSSSCPNGDFEMGTFQNWQAYSGYRTGLNVDLGQMSPGVVPQRHMIVTPGADGIVPINRVGEGNYAARLGDPTSSAPAGSADILAYTFTVTPQNQSLAFLYATVFEKGHGGTGQPMFGYYIVRGTSIMFSPLNLPVYGKTIAADSSDPFFSTKGNVIYRDWTPACVDLSRHLGETMTIVFIAADCAGIDHWGYAYIDALCLPGGATARFEMPPEMCGGATLLCDGSASTGATSHFWSVQESDAYWNGNPQTEVFEWFVAHQPGPIDLTAWYASKGKTFKCNSYYRVKLAVSSDCTPWNEVVHLLHVHCPVVDAGPDACVSCTPNGKQIQLGTGSNAPATDHSYSWSPAAGLSNASAPRPTHAHGSTEYPITYTLTVTDRRGCRASDSVTLYCRPPEVKLRAIEGCCNTTLVAESSYYSQLTWSTGEVGASAIKVSEAGTYSVTVSNPCGSATASVTVAGGTGRRGPFSVIAAQQTIGPNPPVEFHIFDPTPGLPAGGTPAYNATEYRLMIFSRVGPELVKEITGAKCEGFPNWSIKWDTNDKYGVPVPIGVYDWRIEFRNCDRDWGSPLVRRYVTRVCVKWFTLFGVKLWCTQHNVPVGTTEDVTGGSGWFAIRR